VADKIVISDVRFPNEAEWIRQHGGYVVRVAREVKPVAAHESEAHTAGLQVDDEVDNRGHLSTLHSKVDALLDRLHWRQVAVNAYRNGEPA
jgi:hypothetical protein